MERDIDKIMVNSYNPEITRAWMMKDDEGLNNEGNNIDILQEEEGEEVMPTMLDGSKHTLETGCLPNQSSGHIPTQSTGFMPN